MRRLFGQAAKSVFAIASRKREEPGMAHATILTRLAEAQALERNGDKDGAEAVYGFLHQQSPGDPVVLLAWAGARRRRRDFAGAAPMLQAAIERGGGPAALIALAAVMLDVGQTDQAAQLLTQAGGRGGAALTVQQGRLAEAQGRLPQAIELYRAASRIDPNDAEPRMALGGLRFRMGEVAEAEAAFRTLATRQPDNADALFALGYVLGNQRRFHEALAIYDRLAAMHADVGPELAQVALGFMHMCDWTHRASLTERLLARIERSEPLRVDPYVLLASWDDPAAHRRFAALVAAAIRLKVAGLPRPVRHAEPSRRIRLGYLCGDLNQHATSLLLGGVIEAHDRSRFQITAYDYSAEDGTPIRARMTTAFERFVRVTIANPAEVAAQIAADGTDILIDLAGYTDRPCSAVMALRPAPVQLNFLGYVATQAAEWIDGIIADAIVVPPGAEADWSERILRMPNTYFPSDRSRPCPAPDRDRAAHGLPETGFVFACFNSPHKISPERFAAWMQLLHALPDSVLWLYAANDYAAPNLRREATAAGIDPARLVFAPPVKLDAHLARHGCADLFLDTLPYGAHTTAMDALWAGVPIITLPGRSFASRVGASILHAAGLDDLIADTPDDYIALALALARDPARLAAIRERVAAIRETGPLFDAERFARDLEALITAAV